MNWVCLEYFTALLVQQNWSNGNEENGPADHEQKTVDPKWPNLWECPFGGQEPATLSRYAGSSNYWKFARCLLNDRHRHGGGRKLSC
jgi:hypothetical protein